jgi:hypothetical protein
MKFSNLSGLLPRPRSAGIRLRKYSLFALSPRLANFLTHGLLNSRALQIQRHFLHTTIARHQDVRPPTTFSDPDRPDIFYHLLHPPNSVSDNHPVYAVSFLPSPPPTPTSATILGWLPAQTSTESSGSGLRDFVENSNAVFALSLHWPILIRVAIRGISGYFTRGN